MKYGLKYAFGMIALGMAGFASGPADSATTANRPYYATPSWDQQLACATASNCPRFVVLSNWTDTAFPSGGAAVLDRETGLVWERAPGTVFPFTGPQTWNNAIATCRQISVGHRLGWRLPTIEELQSLIDPVTPTHTLPPGHPFQNIQTAGSQVYWSSTVVHGTLPFVYVEGFNATSGSTDPTNTNFVWCVRGGAGVTPL